MWNYTKHFFGAFMKKHPQDKDIVRIANFMNGFLGFEMLEEIPVPSAFSFAKATENNRS